MSKRYDRIDYHPHALQRMRQRKVSERQVERCVQEPDRESSSKTSSNIQAERDTDLSTLIVWYEKISQKRVLIWSVVRRKK